jgi:hypothetical protein
MKIIIESISHSKQRYDTVGDWWWEGETLQIRVSTMSSWVREFKVVVHELTEVMLCKLRGITQKQVDDYDLTHPDAGGDERDMVDAPYLREHSEAMTIERMLNHFTNDNWVEYEEELDSFSQEKTTHGKVPVTKSVR